MELTKVDIQNLLLLLAKTPIVGAEAVTVAVLQQKLGAILNAPPPPQGRCCDAGPA